jgi:signal transduction histidine kinase
MIVSDFLKSRKNSLSNFLAIPLSLVVVAILGIWSLFNYSAAPNFYGPRAIFSIILLSVLLSLLGRILLLRMLKLETDAAQDFDQRWHASWRTLFLFDITAPLYLAAGVLIGAPAAVLTALVTQIVLQLFTFLRRFVSPVEACYRIACTGLISLIACVIYTWIAGTRQNKSLNFRNPLVESNELLGAIAAACIMLLLFIVVMLPVLISMSSNGPGATRSFKALLSSVLTHVQAYLRSPLFRFQALVLSVGPLLPVVDIYDDAVGEIAWLFFLVPLFAIYYLALVTTRLGIRTDALQQTLTDLSSARRRQDELRDYASLVTRVQEEERRRLARELHDDTAQALIALSLGLDGLGRAMARRDIPEKDVQWLESLQNLAENTLEGVRRACRDLRPSILDDLGLHAALEWLCDGSSSRGVPCSFTCSGVPLATTAEAEIALFRIAQEALSNTWRHAQAHQASLEIRYQENRIQLVIQDDGIGFHPHTYLEISPSSQGGLGLVGMRERASLIGAELSISSSPGNGCSVILSLPVTYHAGNLTSLHEISSS